MITLRTAGVTYRYEPWRELFLYDKRGWTKAEDIRVGDWIRDYDGVKYSEVLEVEGVPRPWWERLDTWQKFT